MSPSGIRRVRTDLGTDGVHRFGPPAVLKPAGSWSNCRWPRLYWEETVG